MKDVCLPWDSFWDFMKIQSDTIKRANYLQIAEDLKFIANGTNDAVKSEVFRSAPDEVKRKYKISSPEKSSDISKLLSISIDERLKILKGL